MIAKDLRSGVEQLGNMIAEASCIVPFTGAGISTECGIPDFRSPGGLWTRNRPIAFDEFCICLIIQEAPDGYRVLNDCTRVWKDGRVEQLGWPRVSVRR